MVENKLNNSTSDLSVNSTKKSPTLSRSKIATFLIIAFILDVAVFYAFVTSKRVSEGDFFIPWKASQEMLFHGRNPYSDEVTALIQIGISGHVFGPEVADRLSFNYPLYDALLLAPFTPLPYPLVEAIWNVINQFALVALVWQLTKFSGWQPRSRVKIGLYLWAFIFYGCIFTIGYGQYTILTVLAVIVGARLLQNDRNGWAGVILALALFKPQTSAILVGILLFWCLLHYRERWKALLSFGISFGLMLILPLLWLPDWIGEWLASSAYRRLHPGMYSGAEEFFHVFLGIGWNSVFIPGAIIAGLLILGLLWLGWQLGPNLNQWRYLHLLSLAGLITLVALPQYGGANDMVLYPALILAWAWLDARFNSSLLLLAYTVSIVVPYIPIFGFNNFMGFWYTLRLIIIVTAYIWIIWLLRQTKGSASNNIPLTAEGALK